MNLLAIETATDACSCALSYGGDTHLMLEHAPRRHAELILGMVDELLGRVGADLSTLAGIAFGQGPGSFTGVRLATGVAQGLAYGAGLPVAPVSTLAALAQGAFRRGDGRRALIALDARMSEVYWGVFESDPEGLARPVIDEQVADPARVEQVPTGDLDIALGEGWQVHAQALSERLGFAPLVDQSNLYPEAVDVLRLGQDILTRGQGVEPHQALPVYLRDRVTSA